MRIPSRPLISGILLALTIAACFALFFRPVETGDIWWHLKAGAFIWQHHRVPLWDPFPFASEHTLWILTQWLGSLGYYMVYALAGIPGLVVGRAVFFTLLVLLVVLRLRKSVSLPVNLALGLVFACALATRALLRPFVFNFLFIQIFLVLLFLHRRTVSWRKLLILLGSGWIWINIHLGAFMYGVALFGVFWLTAALDVVQTPKETLARRRLFQLSVALLVYLALFWITPYGAAGALHPWRTLFQDNYLHFKEMATSIGELSAPSGLFSLAYFWFYIFVILGLIAIGRAKKERFLYTVLFSSALAAFLWARRSNIFFCLVSLYIFSDGASDRPFDLVYWKKYRVVDTILTSALVLAFFAVYFLQARAVVYQDGRYYTKWQPREDRYNLGQTLQFFQKNNIRGAVFNDDRYGGYLLFYAYPQLRPFLDSRQLNYAAFDLYHAIRRDPGKIWPAVSKIYAFRAVLLDAAKPVNRKLIFYFLKNPDWRLVQIFRTTVLFLPRDLPLIQQPVSLTQFFAKKPSASPHAPPNLVYNEMADTSMTLFDLGFRQAALQQMQEAYQKGIGREQNLIYRRMRQLSGAPSHKKY